MTGADVGSARGINNWTYGAVVPQVGRLGSWGEAGSLHPGGCMVGMADGAVIFLPQTTNLTTRTRLAQIGDGEVVALP